ncbi:MAG: AgmX/PglI C-terminal domain-containing protein [Gemmatimonadaceae bacterium]
MPTFVHAQTARTTPVVSRADTITVAALLQDTAAVEQVDAVVRSRHREVQFCFEESGLKADPDLTGIFAMMLTLDTSGGVARVDPVRGAWSGPDGAAVESCVMQRARAWRFPVPLALAPARHEVTFHFAR